MGILLRNKFKLLLLLIVGFSLLLWQREVPFDCQETEIPRIITLLPRKDRKRLEYFFRRLVFWDSAGYVLMGRKPCCLAAIQNPSIGNLESWKPSNIRFWLGWKAWVKYEKYFPHSSFSIIQKDRFLVFANKVELEKIIDEHWEEFGTKDFLSSDVFTGIVLGYGKGNAQAYSAQQKDSKIILRLFVGPEENKRFSDYIRSQGIFALETGALFNTLSEMPLPGFGVIDDNSIETVALRERYKKVRASLIDYYRQKDFLEATLLLLNQDSSVE